MIKAYDQIWYCSSECKACIWFKPLISSSAHVLATIPKSVMLSSLDTVPGLKSTKPLHTLSQAITKLHIQPFSLSTTQKVYLVLQCTTKMKTTNNTKNDAKLLGEKKQENSRALDL